jgi:poly(A) polymerase
MTALPPQPWQDWPGTRAVLDAFARAGEEVRFVGGCVRDSLLGRAVSEVDLATPATPQRVTELLTAAGLRAIPTGLAHGTLTALAGEHSFEITTLRADTGCDGRHADVTFTRDWQQDAQRRDFTVNALYAEPDGTLHDHTGGLADLAERQLRFIGDAGQRVREDYLRILRYFRFCGQFGWHISNQEALDACRAHAEGIDALSGERIRQEMLKILAIPHLDDYIFFHLQHTNVWPRVWNGDELPEAQYLVACEEAWGEPPDPLRRLALFLLQLPAQARMERLRWLRERWRLSNDQHALLAQCLATPLSHLTPEREQKKILREIGAPVFTLLALLHHARELGENTDAAESLALAYVDMRLLAREWTPPAFPLSGADLLARGMQPGVALGQALKRLEALWEENHYTLGRDVLLGYLDE